jgi:glycosyltransferase involved in cell wall biosynthesis
MNILFVLYEDFRANSAVHVHNFANQLVSFGNHVVVAVPENKTSCENLGPRDYAIANFSEISGDWSGLFKDARPPALVHGWTPRENVRRLCEKLKRFCSFELCLHLEDNEETIFEANLQIAFSEGERMSEEEIPSSLVHPRRYRQFLGGASGITIIMDRLEKFVPPATPRLLLWPGASSELFYPRPKDKVLLEELRIPVNSIILCYTGNVHAANAREVRSLYLAVAMLNREGVPTTLVRAGRDYYPFLGADKQWARKYSVELDYVKHTEIGRVLSLADFLIQPGTANEFNEYRLPSKLPEFFAMGRPVVLPQTNVGRFVQHGIHAWVLPKVDALGIVQTIIHFLKDPSLVQRLGEGALNFYAQNFDWKKSARTLEGFYRLIVDGAAKAGEGSQPPGERTGTDVLLQRPDYSSGGSDRSSSRAVR